MCLYIICKGYRKSLGPKFKKKPSLFAEGKCKPSAKGCLCREPELPALGKGSWPGPSFRRWGLCRVPVVALGKGHLFAESLTMWLSAKVTTTTAVHSAVPLPRACLCREPLGKADLCLEPLFAESLAVGKGFLPRGWPSSRQRLGPSQKLVFPVVPPSSSSKALSKPRRCTRAACPSCHHLGCYPPIDRCTLIQWRS